MQVISNVQPNIGGLLPLDSLDEAAVLDGVEFISVPIMITHAGEVDSQGLEAMNITDAVRRGLDSMPRIGEPFVRGIDGTGERRQFLGHLENGVVANGDHQQAGGRQRSVPHQRPGIESFGGSCRRLRVTGEHSDHRVAGIDHRCGN